MAQRVGGAAEHPGLGRAALDLRQRVLEEILVHTALVGPQHILDPRVVRHIRRVAELTVVPIAGPEQSAHGTLSAVALQARLSISPGNERRQRPGSAVEPCSLPVLAQGVHAHVHTSLGRGARSDIALTGEIWRWGGPIDLTNSAQHRVKRRGHTRGGERRLGLIALCLRAGGVSNPFRGLVRALLPHVTKGRAAERRHAHPHHAHCIFSNSSWCEPAVSVKKASCGSLMSVPRQAAQRVSVSAKTAVLHPALNSPIHGPSTTWA